MTIDINTASVTELAEIEGLGEERAQAIVDYRDETGGFESLDELKDLPGFSEDTVAMLRERGATVAAPAGIEDEIL